MALVMNRIRWTLVVAGACCLVALGIAVWVNAPSEPMTLHSPVVRVSTEDEWTSEIARGRSVLFVDCDWGISQVAFRRPFQSFADWCSSNDVKPITLLNNGSDDEVSQICKRLWAENDIEPGGMRFANGAGRVVWFESGQVLAYDWCFNLWKPGDLNSFETLKSRTYAAFNKP